MLSPDGNKSGRMDQQMNDSSQFEPMSAGGNSEFLNDQLLLNDFSSNSREILEPTLKNLKRMELKNQRRDMQTSIVSSSINNIIEMNKQRRAEERSELSATS